MSTSYSLRDLPLPVKVVASVFLMAVGLGYTSAMVQLHMQDSKSGKPMPTVADVVLKYTGKKWFETDPPRPVSKLERLVMGSTEANAVFNGSGSMGPAFFSKDQCDGLKNYRRQVAATPDKKAEIDAQREGERQVVKAWLNAPDAERRETYEADSFVPPEGAAPKAIEADWKAGAGFKVKSILEARCVTCHSKAGTVDKYPLETYEQLEKYMGMPTVATVPPGGGWVRIDEPLSMDKLTQTTHIHLLSFAMLFSLTGVIFAFSNYPTSVRLVLGPWVTVAVVADVSLWWLARLCDQWGPYFAMGIIGTGGLAGLGLGAQITLSLFSMYGRKGKAVMALLFLLGGAIGGLVAVNKVKPALDAKQSQADKPPAVNLAPPKDTTPPKVDDKKGGATVTAPPSRMELLLAWPVKGPDGKLKKLDDVPFTGDDEGAMARAFFDKEKVYKNRLNDDAVPQAERDKLHADRDGERAALVAWIRAADPARKAAYDADGFVLPPEIGGKPVTREYVKDGKVLVKTIIADRCVRCHAPGAKQQDFPLTTYDELKKYIDPPGAAAPAPVPPKAVDPIPTSKDD